MNRLFIHISAISLLLLAACTQSVTYPTTGRVHRFSPELDQILPPDARLEILAEGFEWSEGPLWIPEGEYLLFSDIPPNKVVRWKEGEGASTYLSPSGFTGDSTATSEPGANGLLLDAQGRLVLCQHGDRRMARMNAPLSRPRPEFSTLADRWNGKRLNSPNDAVFDRQGRLWFTDPPYGLPGQAGDPTKEIPFQGVYRVNTDGTVQLMIDSLSRPNGIAFSPDEKTLYVANSDPERAIWMAYPVQDDGALAPGRVFYDATAEAARLPGLPDGLKVDARGTVFATGPGGVWIFHPDGRVLGRIETGQATANCAFGHGGKALYITADMYLMRIRLR